MPALSMRDLEDAVRSGDSRKRRDLLRAVTDLFMSNAPSLDETRVVSFDGVFDLLLQDQSKTELAHLSQRMAPVGNAPPRLIKRLASDEEIAVAGPVLMQSPRLSADDLCEIARAKGNAHMLAISARRKLSEAVTDVLVLEGDRQVVRSVANNRAALLSETAMDRLVEHAKTDPSIDASLWARPDIPQRLLDSSYTQAAAQAQEKTRRIAAATRLVMSLKQKSGLNEEQLAGFAVRGEYESLVAAVALRVGLRYQIVEGLMHSKKLPGLILICKSLALSLKTVDAVLRLAKVCNQLADAEIAQAHRDFVELSRATAERVVRFWQLRDSAA